MVFRSPDSSSGSADGRVSAYLQVKKRGTHPNAAHLARLFSPPDTSGAADVDQALGATEDRSGASGSGPLPPTRGSGGTQCSARSSRSRR